MKLKQVIAAIMAAGFALPMIAGAAGEGGDKFGMLDTNKDNVIDRQEAAADPDVNAAFDEINASGSGQITVEEFAAWEEVSGSQDPAAAPEDPAATPEQPDAPAAPAQ